MHPHTLQLQPAWCTQGNPRMTSGQTSGFPLGHDLRGQPYMYVAYKNRANDPIDNLENGACIILFDSLFHYRFPTQAWPLVQFTIWLYYLRPLHICGDCASDLILTISLASFACCGLCIRGDGASFIRYVPAMQTMGDSGSFSYWQHYQEYLRGLQNSAATALSNSVAAASAPMRPSPQDASFPTLGSHHFSALPPNFEPALLDGAYGNLLGGHSGSRNRSGRNGDTSQGAGGGGFMAPTAQSAAGNYYEHKFATTLPPQSPAPTPPRFAPAKKRSYKPPATAAAAAAAAASVAAVMAATAAFAADDTSTGDTANGGASNDAGSRGGEESIVASLSDPWSIRARFDGNVENASRSGENDVGAYQQAVGNDSCYLRGGGSSSASTSSYSKTSSSEDSTYGKSSSDTSNALKISSKRSSSSSSSSRSFDSCLGKRSKMSQEQTMRSNIGGSFHEGDTSKMPQLGPQDHSMSEAAALLSNLAASAPASQEYLAKGSTAAQGEGEDEDDDEEEAANGRVGKKDEENRRFASRQASAAHSAQSASFQSTTAAAIAELQMAQHHLAPNFGLRNLRQGVVQFDLTVSRLVGGKIVIYHIS